MKKAPPLPPLYRSPRRGRPKKEVPATPVPIGQSSRAIAERRKRFVEEYITNGQNAQAAAAVAGYKGKSPSRMLNDPVVTEMLEKRSREIAQAADMNTANWASELRAVAFSSIGDMFTADGRALAPWELPDRAKRAIKSFKANGKFVEYRLWDKTTALETMAKHLGLFERDNTQKGQDIFVKVNLVG